MAETAQPKKRGPRDVILVILAAGLMILPSYLGSLAVSRFNITVSIAAVVSLLMFVAGAFLLARLLRD